MFGGYNSGLQERVLRMDGNNWRRCRHLPRRPIRDLVSLAYAPNTGQLLMFGGGHRLHTTSETWTGVVIGETTPPSIRVTTRPTGSTGGRRPTRPV